MSEEKEPTLIIKSEDLQDPKKLAFVKAIVGSKDVDGDDLVFVGWLWSDTQPFHVFIHEYSEVSYLEEIRIKISDIKLEPRLLIGEDVPCTGQFNGTNVDDEIKGRVGWCIDDEMLLVNGYGVLENSIKPSLQWLKENFEVI